MKKGWKYSFRHFIVLQTRMSVCRGMGAAEQVLLVALDGVQASLTYLVVTDAKDLSHAPLRVFSASPF